MPSLDFNILDAIESRKIVYEESKSVSKTTTTTSIKDGHSMSTEDSHRLQMLMKAFKPPPDDEGDITPTRKKKMFSSSSFYEEPRQIYPTVEEQVKLCKSIADSLSSDSNQMSRGASMYIKRMKRAHKWVHEGPDPVLSEPEQDQHPSLYDSSDSNRPRLKLVLDPRQLQDASKLAKMGIYNEHNVISPDICFELVRDLNSPTGKGAALFAKRKKKSEKWIVDEESVREAQIKQQMASELPDVKPPLLTQQRPFSYTQPMKTTTTTATAKPQPANKLQELQERLNPRLRYIKSPWEAALESPIGSCDAAFEVVPRRMAAFAKPSPLQPVPPLKDILDVLPQAPPPPLPKGPSKIATTSAAATLPRSTSPYGTNTNLYKPKAPRGWTGYSGDQPLIYYQDTSSVDASSFYRPSSPAPPPRPASSKETSSSFQKFSLDQFQNYNSKPMTWGEAKHQPNKGFRPVRPKSLIVTK